MNAAYQSVLAAGPEKKYRMLEEEIMKDVVRRIRKTGKITSTADWQLQRYMVLGHSTEEVETIIRQAVGGDWADTFRMYDEVIEQEYVRARKLYEQVNAHYVPYEENLELQQLTHALIQQSNEELFNISKSLGFMVDMGGGRLVFTPLAQYYNEYLDNAIVMMASGAFDYNTLVRKVVGQMTASGLRTVDYASGHSNRADVAVRRALLTGMGQLTGHISDRNAQALGTDKFEIDWHHGARPDHTKWQGRVWTRQQLVDVCGLGTGAGLLGWNCRHTYYPFLEGISTRNYSDQWLAEMDRKEAQRIAYRGREYNAYEATQKQRRMETAMRAQREKAQLLKEGGAEPDDVLNARCKYQAMLDDYKEFSRKFNLPEQRERIYADLRGRVAPSQRTYKKWQAEQADKAAKRAAEKERKAEREQRMRVEKNRRSDMDAALHLFRKYSPDLDISTEQARVEKVILAMPERIQKILESGTIIDIGRLGASQYDYFHDILYIAKDANHTEIIHEIGHLVENKLLDVQEVSAIRRKLIGKPSVWDIKVETYYDAGKNPHDIFLLDCPKLISEYQGRIYTDYIMDAFDEDGNFKDELLWEFISEPFREYVEDPENLKRKSAELFNLIRRVVE